MLDFIKSIDVIDLIDINKYKLVNFILRTYFVVNEEYLKKKTYRQIRVFYYFLIFLDIALRFVGKESEFVFRYFVDYLK